MNWFIIVFFIISISLYFITKYYIVEREYKNKKINEKIEAFESEQHRTPKEKLQIQHNITINYLDIPEAQQLVVKTSDYLQGMNQANLSARHCLNSDDLYEKYKNGFDTITAKEKDTIDEFILNLLNDINKFNTHYYKYVSKWLNEISFAKAKSWLEAGMPHTLEKTIVIESGLQESDIVVTEGQIRIKDGITAKAKQ